MPSTPSCRRAPHPTLLRAALLAAAASPGAATATTVDWLSPTPGSFSNPANWSPAVIPGTGDTASFNAAAPAPYTVTLDPFSRTVAGLTVAHDNVALDLLGRTLSVTSTFTVGSAACGTLAVTNGTLSTPTTYVGKSAGDSGSYTLSAARWTAGPLILADNGNASLSLTDGTTLTALDMLVLAANNNSATATLSIDASTLTLKSSYSAAYPTVVIGNSGHATAAVINGGAVVRDPAAATGTPQFTILGQSRYGVGTLTVDGPGSRWEGVGTVGYAGTGSLSVSNGAVVTSPSAIAPVLGYLPGSTGTASLTGAGSAWTTPSLVAGLSGTGSISVRDGANLSASAGDLALGSAAGSTGSLTIDGPATLAYAHGSLYIGASGAGTAAVANGGTLSAANTYLAYNAGSTASASIDGPASTWSTGAFTVGSSARATLTATGGATLLSTSAYVSRNSTAGGSAASLDGPNTRWTIAGPAEIGSSSPGSCTLTNGAAITSTSLQVGPSYNSYTGTSSLTLDGPGTSWTVNAPSNSGSATVFGPFGSPDIVVSVARGASLTTVNARLNSHTTLTLDGANSAWTNKFAMYSSRATIRVAGGATLTNAGFSATIISGSFTVTGPGSSWTNAGGFAADHSNPFSLTVADGGSFSNTSALLAGIASVTGPGSTWNNSQELQLSAPTGTTATPVTIAAGGTLTAASAVLNARTSVSVADPTSRWSMPGNLVVAAASSISATNGAAISNATAQFNGSGTLAATASIAGPGSSWSNAGSLYIGGTPTAAGGMGTVSLSDGAAASVAATLRLWNSPTPSSLTLANATLSAGALALNATPGPSSPGAITLTGHALALGSGALYLGGNAAGPIAPAALTLAAGGSLSLAGPLVVWPAASLSFAGGTLTLAPAARLTWYYDAAPSPALALRTELRANRLTSPSLPPHTSLGYLDTGSSVLLQPTPTGDANLDGKLNADDYALLDRGYAINATTWQNGDFNYDGTINNQDYLLIDTTYLSQAPGLQTWAPLLTQRESQFGAPYVTELLASIPEPTSAVACLFATFPTLTRRKVRKS